MHSVGCDFDHSGNGEIEAGMMGVGIPTRHLLQTVQRELLTPSCVFEGLGFRVVVLSVIVLYLNSFASVSSNE